MGNRQFLGKHLLPLALLGGDVIAVIVFVYIGQRDHDLVNAANPLLGVLFTSGLFALPWVLAGWWLGAFPHHLSSAGLLLARSLNTWLVAAPLGLLLRAYVLNRAVIPTAFITATFVFGGLFLLGWRAILALAWKIAASRARAHAPTAR